MVKYIQTIHRQQPTNCLIVFDYFLRLAIKGIRLYLIPDDGNLVQWCALIGIFDYQSSGKSNNRLFKKTRNHIFLIASFRY